MLFEDTPMTASQQESHNEATERNKASIERPGEGTGLSPAGVLFGTPALHYQLCVVARTPGFEAFSSGATDVLDEPCQ